MTKMIIMILILNLVIVNTLGETRNDDEANIPDFPYKGKTYSGYLDLSTPGKSLHYLFNPSSGKQETDPLVLWLNGGPGCSSMLGWAQEHGPGILENDKPFIENPYSWNTVANMIYLESPAGVGFSYFTDPKDVKSNDIKSGKENLEALKEFFKRYPTFKSNEFYISGESYAGIYVPTLASMILDFNQKSPKSDQINLKGILVGNGVTDWRVDTQAAVYDFACSHALCSIETYEKYKLNCKDQPDDEKCNVVKAEIQHQMEDINIYDIYRYCYSSKTEMEDEIDKLGQTINSSKNLLYRYTPWIFQKNKYNQEKFLSENLKHIPGCIDGKGVTQFFNRSDVKKALHVKEDITWDMCSDPINFNYEKDIEKGSIYLYPKLLIANLRILIYSGDTDAAVPINGTLNWIKNLNLPITSPWRSWFVNKDVAGYTIDYLGLKFVSVKGVGHMVPQWARAQSLYMFTKFLLNQDL